MMEELFRVEALSISYTTRGKRAVVVRDVSFAIRQGESYGLVGESGCGKSTIALAAVRYLPRNGVVESGRILLRGNDIAKMRAADLRGTRGRGVAMVYQDPSTALNPIVRIGAQVAEVYRIRGASKADATLRANEMLDRVALSGARIARRYPHELSGGQQQRAVIAMALAADPALLVLDEPTTGLDTTVQAEVLALVDELRSSLDAGILFISHDLGLVAQMCSRVGVLYAGRLVEEAPADAIFRHPNHPYTAALLRCLPQIALSSERHFLVPIPGQLPGADEIPSGCVFAPRCELARDVCVDREPDLAEVSSGRLSRCFFPDEVRSTRRAVATPPDGPRPEISEREPLLEVRALAKRFQDAVAVDDLSFDVGRGEILGLVGESGSGKTTLARCLAGLTTPDAGEVTLDGNPVARRVEKRDLATRHALQMVFQNPDSTLNPSYSVAQILSRAVRKLHGTRTASTLAADVQLSEAHRRLKARQLSGGLKQRVAIARAFAGNPRLVLCDEPVSSLDVSVQAAILNLLRDLSREQHVAFIFISHDLSVVHYLSDRIAVMYRGRIVELGTADEVFGPGHHPYTETLLASLPNIDAAGNGGVGSSAKSATVTSEVPSGCPFHTRCPVKIGDVCETEVPPWRTTETGHGVRCHIEHLELRALQVTSSELRD